MGRNNRKTNWVRKSEVVKLAKEKLSKDKK
jgi:hypothetical protein